MHSPSIGLHQQPGTHSSHFNPLTPTHSHSLPTVARVTVMSLAQENKLIDDLLTREATAWGELSCVALF
jgi:hypothetical protein